MIFTGKILICSLIRENRFDEEKKKQHLIHVYEIDFLEKMTEFS